jgi:hypothetical protein
LESGLLEQLERKLESLGVIIENVPEKVKCNIMENFSINGAIPLSYHDMERFIDTAIQKLSQQINSSSLELRAELENRRSSTVIEVADETSSNPFTTFNWGGAMGHLVPEGFIFPNTNARTMWSLWFHGDRSRKIHPYRLLIANHHQKDIQQKSTLTRTSNVMRALMEIARRHGHTTSSITALDPDKSNKLFAMIYAELVSELYDTPPNRPFEITCDSLGNRMYKRKRL